MIHVIGGRTTSTTRMRTKSAVVWLLLALYACGPAFVSTVAAQTSRWTAHTSMRAVEDISVSTEALWAATQGGIFSYTPATGEFMRYTAADGLHSVQTRAIAHDARRDAVWVGYVDGAIDRLDLETGTVETFFDIQRNDRFPSREINQLYVRGDTLLIATAFGLVIFDPEKKEVRDTYSQLGTLPPATPVRDVTVAPVPGGADGLWLATGDGVAYASLSTANLQDPGAWTVEREVLPDPETHTILPFAGRIYVGTTRGLAVRQGDGTYTRMGFSNQTIYDLADLTGRLLAIDDFRLYAIDPAGGSLILADGFGDLNAVAVGPDGNMWTGGGQTGLTALARLVANERPAVLNVDVYPEGPFDGLFEDLTVDASGDLWAGAVRDIPGSGFYRLGPGGEWTNYTLRFFDQLEGKNNFNVLHADRQGNLWAGSFGYGLARVTPDGTLDVFDASNSTLSAASGTSSFVIVGGVSSEDDGTLWVTNTTATRPLHVRTPDGTWTGLPAPSGCSGLLPTTALGNIFVDSFGNKWITVLQSSNLRLTRGLLVLDTADTPTDPSDDVCTFIGERGSGGQGLPSIGITDVTGDRDGRVWIGTEEGPAFVFSSTLAAASQPVPVWPLFEDRDEGVYVLGGVDRLRINDIAVDPSNRVWMATNEGAFLFEDVGTGTYRQVHAFSESDSPLFSNVVLAVTVDPATGEVYFATDQGLISYQGEAVEPVADAQDLFVYPNPVRIRDGEETDVFIQNLVEETDIKIIAPHGGLVTSFSARGGRARWNARDRNDQLVPSGVYLIVAVGKNGEGTAYGKVAVIH